MNRKLTTVVIAFAFGALAVPSAFATDDRVPASGEASAAPHGSPSRTTRAEVKQQVPAGRADATLGANVGEASRSPERPRASGKTRDQVKQETRASRNNRTAADGWEQVGGEAGSRSGRN